MPATDYLRGKLYDHIFRNVSYTSPTNLYIEWCSSATVPTSASAGTASGAGRDALAMNDDGGDGIGDNTSQIASTVMPAGEFPYLEIWDASSAGNRLFYATAASSLFFGASGTAYIDAGNLVGSVVQGSGTDYLRNAIYDHIFRNSAFTSPASLYAEICTTATTPTSATAGTASGVGRTAVTMADDAGGLGSGLNSGAVIFTGIGAMTIGFVEFWDASTSGNRLTFAPLAGNLTFVGTGNTLTFPVGTLAGVVT